MRCQLKLIQLFWASQTTNPKEKDGSKLKCFWTILSCIWIGIGCNKNCKYLVLSRLLFIVVLYRPTLSYTSAPVGEWARLADSITWFIAISLLMFIGANLSVRSRLSNVTPTPSPSAAGKPPINNHYSVLISASSFTSCSTTYVNHWVCFLTSKNISNVPF